MFLAFHQRQFENITDIAGLCGFQIVTTTLYIKPNGGYYLIEVETRI